MEVDVEVLDVTEAEARALLLSIDPLAAQTQEQTTARLFFSARSRYSMTTRPTVWPPESLSRNVKHIRGRFSYTWKAGCGSREDACGPLHRMPNVP